MRAVGETVMGCIVVLLALAGLAAIAWIVVQAVWGPFQIVVPW